MHTIGSIFVHFYLLRLPVATMQPFTEDKLKQEIRDVSAWAEILLVSNREVLRQLKAHLESGGPVH